MGRAWLCARRTAAQTHQRRWFPTRSCILRRRDICSR